MASYTFDTLLDFEIANITLPSGYTKVEWVKPSSANGFITDESSSYAKDLKLEYTALTTSGGSGGTMFGQVDAFRYFSLSNTLYFDITNSNRISYNWSATFNNWNNYEVGNNYIKINGTSVKSGTTYSGTNSSNSFIWFNEISQYKFTKLTNISTSSILHKFFPTLYNGNSGFYDTITNTFYQLDGTYGSIISYSFVSGDTCTITDLGITLTSDGTNWLVTSNITLATLSQASSLLSFAKGNNGVTATITDLGITLTSDGTNWLVTSNITLATFSQASSLLSFAKGNNGVTATITDLGITLTSDGTNWMILNDITIDTLSHFQQLISFTKADSSVFASVTDINITFAYDGMNWGLPNDVTIDTMAHFRQMISFAVAMDDVKVTITDVQQVWWYHNYTWVLYYQIMPPLVFKGFSFMQTNTWQLPESVFKGFSFELADKPLNVDALFFAQN